MLNFGALIGFMGVNASAFMRFYWRAERRRTINLLLPVLGFLVCLILWWNLSSQARILGGVWMAIGLGLGLWRLGGFRMNLDGFEGSEAVAERSEKFPGLKPGEVS